MRAGARVRGVARGRAEHAAGGARVAWAQGRAGPAACLLRRLVLRLHRLRLGLGLLVLTADVEGEREHASRPPRQPEDADARLPEVVGPLGKVVQR